MRQHYEDYWNRDAPPPLNDPLAETRANLLLELAQTRSVHLERFVDFGCGMGWLVGKLQARGIESTGLDISGAAVDMARRLYPEATFNLMELGVDSLPIEAGTFDVAASFEVIEHLMDPAALIRSMHQALRPGGYAALTTPYHGLVKNLAIAMKGFDKHYSVTGDHIRFFSDNALRRMFTSNGFDVVEVRHFGRAPLLWAGSFVWARKT